MTTPTASRLLIPFFMLALTACQSLNPAAQTNTMATAPSPVQSDALPQTPELAVSDSPSASTASVKADAGATDTPPTAEEQLATADLWQRIRQDLSFPVPENEEIISQREWYERNQEFMDRVAGRANRYLHHIVTTLEARQLPMELALLPIVESAFQPYAYSRSRAAGIWQFIPGTGKVFGLQQNWWQDGRRDIVRSTDAALDYLTRLHQMFGGDWQLALAAYNSGEGTVSRAITRNRKKGLPTDFWSLDLPKETRFYVPKLLALVQLMREPERFALHWQSIPDAPYFARVAIDTQIDMSLAAELAGISEEEIYQLNPAYTRWATDPDHSRELLLPLAAVERFQQALAQVPATERVKWAQYTVKKGDTIGKIAKQFKVSTAQIKQTNKLSGNNLKVGRSLLLPKTGAMANGTNSIVANLSTREKADLMRASGESKGTKFHTVSSNETLYSISRKYKISIADLAAANQLTNKSALQIGDMLQLPGKAKTSAPAKSSATANRVASTKTPAQKSGGGNNNQASNKTIGYTVRSGDSLYAIAQKFGVSVADIKRSNNWKKAGNGIKAGQKLKLPEQSANGG